MPTSRLHAVIRGQVRFSFNHQVHTLDEVKGQLAQLQAELGSGLSTAGGRAAAPKNAGVKDGAKRHHIK
jgi:hypothetical protein